MVRNNRDPANCTHQWRSRLHTRASSHLTSKHKDRLNPGSSSNGTENVVKLFLTAFSPIADMREAQIPFFLLMLAGKPVWLSDWQREICQWKLRPNTISCSALANFSMFFMYNTLHFLLFLLLSPKCSFCSIATRPRNPGVGKPEFHRGITGV